MTDTNRSASQPKGKGWIACAVGAEGTVCKPEKVNEAIELFAIAYEVFPDIVARNQIAIACEIIDDKQKTGEYFGQMKEQAERDEDSFYGEAASAGLGRCV